MISQESTTKDVKLFGYTQSVNELTDFNDFH